MDGVEMVLGTGRGAVIAVRIGTRVLVAMMCIAAEIRAPVRGWRPLGW